MFVPAMWSVWGVLALALAAVKVYKERLARDEDDQIILDEAFDNVKLEQAEIVAKVQKLEPIQRAVFWGLGAASLVVVGFYVLDIINQLKA